MHHAAVQKIQIITDMEPKEFVSSDVEGKIFRNFIKKGSLMKKFIGSFEKNYFFPH